jgi:hypothetical protein
MKIINFFKSLFHIFIFLYMLFFFYWQGKNYETIFYEIPHIIKIGIPFSIKEFCYQDMNGEFSGIIIDILDEIFVKKLNINIDYTCIENSNELCDCILNVSGKKSNKNSFIYSNSILDYITLLQIKKNKKNNTKIISLKNDILYLLNPKEKNSLFVDSIEEAITLLKFSDDYDLLISQIYYNDIKKIIIKKNDKIENYEIKKIKKKIKSVNLLFNNKLYWLIILFNTVLRKFKKDQNELQSIKYF